MLACERLVQRPLITHLRPPSMRWRFGVDVDDLAELADDHELAGIVDEVHAGDLADRGVVCKTEFPKWESLKIDPERWHAFSRPNPDHPLPSFHQQFTTT